MKNYANAYEKWLSEVNMECMKQHKFPWNAICHDTSVQREAYLVGKTPEVFVEEYWKEHKPYVGYTF